MTDRSKDDIDVTDKVDFGNPDDESLPVTRCVCGHTWPMWDHHISIYDDVNWMNPCPKCGRRLYFRQSIRVYERVDVGHKDDGVLR